jgi:hypothetical protein
MRLGAKTSADINTKPESVCTGSGADAAQFGGIGLNSTEPLPLRSNCDKSPGSPASLPLWILLDSVGLGQGSADVRRALPAWGWVVAAVSRLLGRGWPDAG